MAIVPVHDLNIVPDLNDRARELNLESIAIELVVSLDASGWVDKTKQSMSRGIPIPHMWRAANTIIRAANDIFEKKLKADGVDITDNKDYYSTPILPGWSARASNARHILAKFHELIFDELELKTRNPLIFAKSIEDLERLGTTREIFSSVFWAEIDSLYFRQYEAHWTTIARINDDLRAQKPWERTYQANILAASKHGFYAFRSKYNRRDWMTCALTIPDRAGEPATFEEAKKSGKILVTGFEKEFRERQTDRASAFFKERLDTYAGFAKRHSVYSLGQSPTSSVGSPTENGFREKRLQAAIFDANSLTDFAEQLGRANSHFNFTSNDESESIDFDDLFIDVTQEVSSELLDSLLKRSLGCIELLEVGQFIFSRSSTSGLLTLLPLRAATELFGGGERSFDLIECLLIPNPSLGNQDQLEKALNFLLENAPPNLRGQDDFHYDSRRDKSKPNLFRSSNLWEFPPVFAILDVLYRVAQQEKDAIRNIIKEFCLASKLEESSLLGRNSELQVALDKSLFAIRALNDPAFGSSIIRGMNFKDDLSQEWAIIQRMSQTAMCDDGEGTNLLFLLEKPFILEVQSLKLVGRAIEQKPLAEKRAILERMLAKSLEWACDAADYPEEKRSRLLKRILDELIQHDRATPADWVSRVDAEATTAPGTVPPTTVIRRSPDTAPALWPDDRVERETPADFIKRNYSDFLRKDGLGLTRADIGKLDHKLYMALSNWLRSNKLPDDCPLPKPSQRLDSEVEAASARVAPENWARLTRARERRGAAKGKS